MSRNFLKSILFCFLTVQLAFGDENEPGKREDEKVEQKRPDQDYAKGACNAYCARYWCENVEILIKKINMLKRRL